MRIIGGDLRGKRLASVGKGDAGAHLRPTTDRVRESIFNVITNAYGNPIPEARVLDLFAGTGALGLEALSRGAARASFVENGRTSLRILRDNIALCRMEDRATVLQRDFKRLGQNADAPYDLIFLDPPYGKAMGEAALTLALAGGWIAEDALIVWEEAAECLPPEGITLLDVRRYGDTAVHFAERG